MKLTDQEVLLSAVSDADMVLVGIGEEWETRFEQVENCKPYDFFFTEEFEKADRQKIAPFLQRNYFFEFHDEKLLQAYSNLARLLAGKNYFIVSMNEDRYPQLIGLDEERCVYPCGGFCKMQCDRGCGDVLTDFDAVGREIDEAVLAGRRFDDSLLPRCGICGEPLVFNRIEAGRYLEQGYMPAWETYRKWLQGTVNRSLCLLELGVSLRFPTVIRWAFEKTAFYNQKAVMFRIHHAFSQSVENIADKCYSCDEDSVTYMANLFVS